MNDSVIYVCVRFTYFFYFTFFIEFNAARMAARGLHHSKPAMQVMSTNPLRATEATVRYIYIYISKFIFLILTEFIGIYCQ